MKEYNFSVIIVTYNRYNYLQKLLKNLFDQKYSNFSITIIDDVSTDKTKNLKIKNSKIHKIIHLNQKTRMVKARNKGILESPKSDYKIIIDDDNELNKDFLSKINCILNKNPHILVAQPKNYHKNRKTPWYFGCNYNKLTMFPQFVTKEFDENFISVDAVANCLIIKEEVLKKVGLFDESYIIDLSEAEFCARVKKIKGEICCINVPIFHQTTTGVELEGFIKRIHTRPETYYYTFLNKYRYIKSFGTTFEKFFFFSFFQFITLAGYAYISIKHKSLKLFIQYLKGFIDGNKLIWMSK